MRWRRTDLADTVTRVGPSSRMAAAYPLKCLAAPQGDREGEPAILYGSGSSPMGEGRPRGNQEDTLEGKDDLVTQDTWRPRSFYSEG